METTAPLRPNVEPGAWSARGSAAKMCSRVPDRKPIRVLLVEGDPDLAQVVDEAAKDTHHWFLTDRVTNLREALVVIEAAPPALVLLGQDLPDSKGMATVRTVVERFPGLPVVVLTDVEAPSDGTEALRAGAQDYLDRSAITPALLEKTLRYAVERTNFAAAIARQQRELEDFATQAAHDLNAPLRSMSGFADILTSKLADELSEQDREYLRQISTGARRLQGLISGLLSYARAGHGEDFTVIELDAVARGVVEDLAAVISEAGAVVHCESLPSVRGQATAVGVALRNLIANAIKYRSKEPPRVQIESRPLGERCLVAVRDNGIGIDREHVDRILRPFTRLHAQTAYEGAGLGLATVDRIVRRHGGTLRVASEVGRGSVFSFDLAVAR